MSACYHRHRHRHSPYHSRRHGHNADETPTNRETQNTNKPRDTQHQQTAGHKTPTNRGAKYTLSDRHVESSQRHRPGTAHRTGQDRTGQHVDQHTPTRQRSTPPNIRHNTATITRNKARRNNGDVPDQTKHGQLQDKAAHVHKSAASEHISLLSHEKTGHATLPPPLPLGGLRTSAQSAPLVGLSPHRAAGLGSQWANPSRPHGKSRSPRLHSRLAAVSRRGITGSPTAVSDRSSSDSGTDSGQLTARTADD